MIQMLALLRDPTSHMPPANGGLLLVTAAGSLLIGIGAALVVRELIYLGAGRSLVRDLDRARAL